MKYTHIALFSSSQVSHEATGGRTQVIAFPVSLEQPIDDSTMALGINVTESEILIAEQMLSGELHFMLGSENLCAEAAKQVSDIFSATGSSDHHLKLLAIIADASIIATHEWIDHQHTEADRTPVCGPSISIAGFLGFVAEISESEHDYRPSIINWALSGEIIFSTKCRSNSSLHVQKINLSKTGLWSMSDFMSLDALIGDYLALHGIFDQKDARSHLKDVHPFLD